MPSPTYFPVIMSPPRRCPSRTHRPHYHGRLQPTIDDLRHPRPAPTYFLDCQALSHHSLPFLCHDRLLPEPLGVEEPIRNSPRTFAHSRPEFSFSSLTARTRARSGNPETILHIPASSQAFQTTVLHLGHPQQLSPPFLLVCCWPTLLEAAPWCQTPCTPSPSRHERSSINPSARHCLHRHSNLHSSELRRARSGGTSVHPRR